MSGKVSTKEILVSVSSLLLGAALLLTGNGLLFTLVPLRASLEQFSTLEVGLLAAGYFSGFTIGCLAGPLLIRRVGHIRVFCALTASVVAAVLLQALYISLASWFFVRLLTGASLAGLYLVMESWLNDAAPPSHRGRVFSIYAVISFLAIIAGQQLLQFAPPDDSSLFAGVAILMALAIIPVSLTTSLAPAPVANAKPRLIWAYRSAPVAAIGCLAVGLANGTFWGLAPMLCQQAGLSVEEIAIFISAAVGGGALCQWPIGYLSDHHDRRSVIAVTALVASLSGSLLSYFGAESRVLFNAAGVAFGATSFSIYALCVSHGNDRIHNGELVALSSSLLLLFSSGAAIGPLAASLAFGASKNLNTLFLFTATTHALLGILVAASMRSRKPVPEQDREPFQAVPDTVPTAIDTALLSDSKNSLTTSPIHAEETVRKAEQGL